MDYYLSFNNNSEQLRLPIIPSEFELSTSTGNTTVNITDVGEFNLIGKTGLATISISSFFPNQEYPFCLYSGFPAPNECIRLISKWQKSGKPIRLIITETPINYAMSIESFTYGESDGSGDVNFTLELKEYRFITNTTAKTTETTPKGNVIEKKATKRETKPTPTEYIVKSGDTLSSIARKMTGNANNYTTIAKANNIKDPNKIYVGQKLVI